MKNILDDLALNMVCYENSSDRIQHFLKVHSFARLIGAEEGLDDETLFTLETAAYVHDIGIKPSMAVYGNGDGPNQERLGMPEADKMLSEMGFDRKVIDRVVYLVGHHHTYTGIDGIDYQILVEADFLVNLFEKNESAEAIRNTYDRIFVTETGKKLMREQFGI